MDNTETKKVGQNPNEWESGFRQVECDCGQFFDFNERFWYVTEKKDKYESQHFESQIKLKGEDKIYTLNSILFVRCSNCRELISYLGLNGHILNENIGAKPSGLSDVGIKKRRGITFTSQHSPTDLSLPINAIKKDESIT